MVFCRCCKAWACSQKCPCAASSYPLLKGVCWTSRVMTSCSCLKHPRLATYTAADMAMLVHKKVALQQRLEIANVWALGISQLSILHAISRFCYKHQNAHMGVTKQGCQVLENGLQQCISADKSAISKHGRACFETSSLYSLLRHKLIIIAMIITIAIMKIMSCVCRGQCTPMYPFRIPGSPSRT